MASLLAREKLTERRVVFGGWLRYHLPFALELQTSRRSPLCQLAESSGRRCSIWNEDLMFIIYENAACLLAALIGGMLLFAAGATCVMLWGAGGITWRWWREPVSRPNWLTGRWTAESRVSQSR